MSGASSNAEHALPREGTALLGTALSMAAVPVRFVGFWAAVALPFLYLPLLYGGLEGQQSLVFVALLVANLVAVLAGHSYQR